MKTALEKLQAAVSKPGKMTPARAASVRKLGAECCGCVQCLWALRPVLTFAEHTARMEQAEIMNRDHAWPTHTSVAALLTGAASLAA